MEGMELVYTANEVYGRLGVSGSTLRKYSDVFEREGYEVRKNNRGRREYTEYDVMLIEQLVEMSKQDGMTLEKAAKMIVQQLGIMSKESDKQEGRLIPNHLQQLMQQQYSAMFEKLNQVQQANLVAMENRLVDHIEKRSELIEKEKSDRKEREMKIEKRLEKRDENLMKMIRGIQDVKSEITSVREEIAAAKKKSWWKFWG